MRGAVTVEPGHPHFTRREMNLSCLGMEDCRLIPLIEEKRRVEKLGGRWGLTKADPTVMRNDLDRAAERSIEFKCV
tara:strand:+ start:193 stop:420 length:228 start_codon:yes stop_codon:yes gene_type:complete